MTTFKVTVKGITPLLMNRFTEAAEIAVSSGTRAAHTSKKETPRAQAEPKLYKNDAGELVIPGPNMFAAIIEAGKFHKVGKNKVTTMKGSLVPAGIALLEIVMPLRGPDWEVDSRSVVNPSTQGRMMCHRPRMDEWELDFTLEVDEEMFHADFARQLVDDAGKKIGLCDYRPARKGPFGKFVVTGWEEI